MTNVQIMAEAFAIKAMCTEKLPPPTSSKTRRTERDDNIVRFYELAGDLTLLFLQQVWASLNIASICAEKIMWLILVFSLTRSGWK